MLVYSDKTIKSLIEINFMVSVAMAMEREVSFPGGP